ncbi:MAG: energy transducer TonB [Sulfuritalea sp.]|nr:energy transducer TonB [Sulfuritalea sp.]
MRALAARRLRYAIAASVLLHILDLWPGTVRVLTKDTPPVLQATLRKPPQPAVELAPPTPARAVARSQSEPAQAPALPRPAAPMLERPTSSSVPQTVAAPAIPVLQAAPRPESAPTATTSTLSASGGALLTEANASGEVVDGLRGYRLAVASQARRFKRYPAQAMASGWEGSAEIRVEVGSDGRPRTATVVRSSGHELLDRAALAMIDAGALRARVPENLRGKAFAVALPVVFNLDDQ